MKRNLHPALEELLLEAYIERQQSLESAGRFPPCAPSVIARGGHWLARLGAIQLGLAVACFDLLAIVIIVNLLFHLEP